MSDFDIIVGGGNTANIVKMFFPKARVIACGFGNKLPLCEMWITDATTKFVSEFGLEYDRNCMVANYLTNGDLSAAIKQYNKITHKPKNNKPSMGKKLIDIYQTILPECKIDVLDEVEHIKTVGKHLIGDRINTYKRLFWCAPIDRVKIDDKRFDQRMHPITVVKMWHDKEVFHSNYIYLFEKKYLDKGLYRVTKKTNDTAGWDYFVEIAADKENLDLTSILECLEQDGFEGSVFRGLWGVPNGHISGKDRPKDTKNIFFIGRFAQNNNELLMSDVVEKCYEIRGKLE